MAVLPRLADYLSQDPFRDILTLDDFSGLQESLDRHEAQLLDAERHAAAVRASLDRFVSDYEGLDQPAEEDVETAVRDVLSEQRKNDTFYTEHLKRAESRLKDLQRLPQSNAKSRAVAFADREIKLLRSVRSAFETSIRRLLSLRDRVLVQEFQQLSSFWEGDE